MGRLESPQNLDVLDNVDLLCRPLVLLYSTLTLDSFFNASFLPLRYLDGPSVQTSSSSHFPSLATIPVVSSFKPETHPYLHAPSPPLNA